MKILKSMIIMGFKEFRFEKQKNSNMIRIFYKGKEIDVITQYDMTSKDFFKNVNDYYYDPNRDHNIREFFKYNV